jgi:folate-binding protein YgfZ
MMQLPIRPETLEQYSILSYGAGFVDVSDRTQVRITGADRVRFFHGFCTNDIQRLPVGAGCEAFLTNVKGKVVGHVFVFCGDRDLILETTPGQAESIIRHLDRYVVREDVQFADLQTRVAELFVAGPRSEAALAELIGAASPAEMLAHQTGHVSGVPISVRRVPLAAVPAFFLSYPVERHTEVQQRLGEAGARPCGPEVFEIVRVEAGFPWYGRDIHEDCLPQEVNRDAQAISFTKGCYLGQETVARIDALGHVNRKLAGVRWYGSEMLQSGQELTVAGQSIGRVTSAVWSPRTRTVLALAYLRHGFDQPGARLETTSGAAEVVDWAKP